MNRLPLVLPFLAQAPPLHRQTSHLPVNLAVTASTSLPAPDLTVSQSAPSVMATPSHKTDVNKWNVNPINKYLQLPTAVKKRQPATSSIHVL